MFDLPLRDITIVKIHFAQLEGYDESVGYPESLVDFCTRQANILAEDYVDPKQGWSDPCPKSCPVCKQQCEGRDQDRHPTTANVHGCGKHCWYEDKHGKCILVRKISLDSAPIDNSDLRDLLTRATKAAQQRL